MKYAREDENGREELLLRPTKGKTARKKRFPPGGKKTNVGDPNRNTGGAK